MEDKLRKLAVGINDELDGAESYWHCAIDYKAVNPEISRIYAEMAEQERGHAERLYTIGEKLIAFDGDDELRGIWKWSRGMLDGGMVKLKAMEAVYKG